MTNKHHHELVTPSLLEVGTEIQRLAREGYSISYGPEYFGCIYIVQFKRDDDEEVVEAAPVQQPTTPAEVKVAAPAEPKPQRGPKPKAKKEVEPTEA